MRVLAIILLAVPSFAAEFLFSASPSQTVNGYPVNVTAAINLLNNSTMVVTLDNLENDLSSDAQALTSFTFSVNGNLGVTNITSSSKTITLYGSTPGDFSIASTAGSSNWKTSATNSSTTAIALCDFNNPGCPGQGVDWPSYALIGGPNGSNAYSNATPAQQQYNIATDPFLYESVTFTITGTNIPSAATLSNTVTSVEFGFGSRSGQLVAGTYEGVATPEPGSAYLLLAAAGLIPASIAAKRFWR